MKKKVVHELRVVKTNGQLLVSLRTKCGVTLFGFDEKHLKKVKEERTSDVRGEVTCKNCLRVTHVRTYGYE